MRKIRANGGDVGGASAAGLTTLVISQHEVVRRQLVTYLGRSPFLAVSGDTFSPETIIHEHPDVLVLDLSQLRREELRQGIDAARRVGARLIALASMYEQADERAVTGAGGLYRLKSAGADSLAEIVQDVATQPASPAISRPDPDFRVNASAPHPQAQPA